MTEKNINPMTGEPIITQDTNVQGQSSAPIQNIYPSGAPPNYSAPPAYSQQQQPVIPAQPYVAAAQPIPGQVVVMQPGVPITNNQLPNTATVNFGLQQMRVRCNLCSNEILTETKKETGSGTWIMCCALWFFTGICCCIPFCCDSCKDTVHSCPHCKRTVGKKEFIRL